jgi:hypothetical protein
MKKKQIIDITVDSSEYRKTGAKIQHIFAENTAPLLPVMMSDRVKPKGKFRLQGGRTKLIGKGSGNASLRRFKDKAEQVGPLFS